MFCLFVGQLLVHCALLSWLLTNKDNDDDDDETMELSKKARLNLWNNKTTKCCRGSNRCDSARVHTLSATLLYNVSLNEAAYIKMQEAQLPQR